MQIIKVLDPKISLRNKSEYCSWIKTALEMSGLVHLVVERLPCDMVFRDRKDAGGFDARLEIQTDDLALLSEAFAEKRTANEFFLEDFAWTVYSKAAENFSDRACFVSRWPNGAPYAVTPTHDVDRTRFFSPTNFARNLLKKNHSYSFRESLKFLFNPKEDPYYCIEKLRDFEGKMGVKSTFFFLAVKRDAHGRRYDAGKMKTVLKDLAVGGWEIALHASIQSKKNPGRLKKEKRKIERASEKNVTGLRYHYLLESEEALYDAELAGFAYDSSVAHPRKWEFVRPSCSYYAPWHKEISRRLKITEFPITLTDMALIAGQEYSPDYADFIKKRKGILNLLWHQRMFSEMFDGRFSEIYESILTEAKKEGAWIATLSEIEEFIDAKKRLRPVNGKNILRAGSDLKNVVLSFMDKRCSPEIRGNGNIEKIGPSEFKVSLFCGDEVVLN